MQGILKLSINICTSSFCIASKSIVVSCCKYCKFVASHEASIESIVSFLINYFSSYKFWKKASYITNLQIYYIIVSLCTSLHNTGTSFEGARLRDEGMKNEFIHHYFLP